MLSITVYGFIYTIYHSCEYSLRTFYTAKETSDFYEAIDPDEVLLHSLLNFVKKCACIIIHSGTNIASIFKVRHDLIGNQRLRVDYKITAT